MSVGDIHWVDFPQANGREQQGRRPAIIVQDDGYGGMLPTTIVVPLSSTKKALRFVGTTLITSSDENGLRHDSVALVFQCRAIDRGRVREMIGKISDTQRQDLFAELAKMMGRSV